MNAPYGRMRVNHRWRRLIPNDSVIQVPIHPQQVYHTCSSRCIGCPYPRHGLMCHSEKDGSCLHTDMQELEDHKRKKYHSRFKNK